MERRVKLASGAQIRIQEDGLGADAPVMLALNGSVLNLKQFDRFVKKGTWTAHFRVIRHDYLGTGASSARTGPFEIMAFADETFALMDALGIEKAHLYGVSQGSIVAQAMAARAPERLLSVGGYGWFHGNYDDLDAVRAHITARVEKLAALSDGWERPLDRAAFDRLWAAVYRQALLNATWEELSIGGRVKDWLARRLLYSVVAPTPIQSMHAWFAYCIEGLPGAQVELDRGLANLEKIPLLIQHARADQTLPYGMAEQLHAAVPGSSLLTYEEGYDHASPAFKSDQCRRLCADHIAFLQRVGALSGSAAEAA